MQNSTREIQFLLKETREPYRLDISNKKLRAPAT